MFFGPEEWDAFALCARVAVCAVAVSLSFGIAAGYLFARRAFPGKWLIETAVNLPLVLPPVVTGCVLLLLFGRNGPIGAFLEQAFVLRVVVAWVAAGRAAGGGGVRFANPTGDHEGIDSSLRLRVTG